MESGVESDFMVLVRELADPEVYPHLTRMARQEPPTEATEADPMPEYTFDIELILDGFERLVERSATR